MVLLTNNHPLLPLLLVVVVLLIAISPINAFGGNHFLPSSSSFSFLTPHQKSVVSLQQQQQQQQQQRHQKKQPKTWPLFYHQKQQQKQLVTFTSLSYSKASTTLYLSNNDEGSSKRPVKIIIAGAPASGKGTQCEIIKEKYGIVHLSTGDMLREAVTANTPIGLLAKEYMDSGKLVPDDVIINIVRERLLSNDCQNQGWLLDGFPRTQAQAIALEDAGVCADLFLFLNVPDDILVERVVGRRTDPVTGKIYHMKFSPPPMDDKILLSRLVHRSDDTEEKVKVRLEQFHANVNAVKDSYTNISVVINGNQSPSIVSEQITTAINNVLNNNPPAVAKVLG